MLPQDVQAFKQIVTMAQRGEKAEAHARLLTLLRTYPDEISLLLWLAQTSPDLTSAGQYIAQAKALSPNQTEVIAAEKWLDGEKAKNSGQASSPHPNPNAGSGPQVAAATQPETCYGKIYIYENANPTPKEFELNDTSILIGRSQTNNNISLSDTTVSREHARLYFERDSWWLENRSIKNPTSIKGVAVSNNIPLKHNDSFEIGPYNIRLGYSDELKNSKTRTILPEEFRPILEIAYEGHSSSYTLEKNLVTLGRTPDNDIVVPNVALSVHHAVFTKNGQDYMIENKSAQGLYIKGQKFPRKLLDNDDVIRIYDGQGNIVLTMTYRNELNPYGKERTFLKLKPDQTVVRIGRDTSNDLVLPYPQVSAQHAQIIRQNNGTFLHDLGSTNGTFVGDQRITKGRDVPIKPGDTILIAGYQLIYQEDNISQASSTEVRLDVLNLYKAVEDRDKKTKILLNNISLSIQPKEFVALLGGSGSGKSTLMDAINGFRTADKGKVLINGDATFQQNPAYRAKLGYVPQDDIIHQDLIVERALYYAAKLRLPPDTKKEDLQKRVEQVLSDVGMTERRQVKVAQLSGGQRKRVSIALELLANPNLLFLDEPTSGLDPGLDKIMMTLLRNLADQGRTVVLVTHATGNIMVCDKVVFLARDGRLAFFGTPAEALDFFGVREFADIYVKLEVKENYEKAEEEYQKSNYYHKYIEQPLRAIRAQSQQTTSRPLAPAKALRVSAWGQFLILVQRYAELIWLDRVNLLILLLQAPIIGCVLALVAGDKAFIDGTIVIDTQRLLFIMAVSSVWLGTSNSARELAKEANIYRRERLVNLQVVPYILSKVTVLALLCVVQSLSLTLVVIARVGAPNDPLFLLGGLELAIGVWLTTMAGVGMGLLVSALASNPDRALTIVPVILVPQIILGGVIFSLDGPGQALSYVTVSKWSLDGLGTSTNLNRLEYYAINKMGLPPTPQKAFDPANYDLSPQKDKKDNESQDSRRVHLLIRWSILAGMTILFIGLACQFQKRRDKA
ncbi:MAG: FHA domain-containing protein [Chloroflexota bacterium]|nr:FHA domain-containing protein [Chloroflexota bacterium]